MLEGCREGRHNDCKRTLSKTYWDERSKKFLTIEGEEYVCKCSKRGCACFAKANERKTQRRKK